MIQDGDADAALDYEIDLTKATDNTIDVYIVEGNPTLWYNEEEAVFQPVIAEAYFSETTSKEIYAYPSRAPKNTSSLAAQLKITDAEGTEYKVASAESEDGRAVLLTLEEALELSKTYDISMEGYEGTTISMNKIIGSSYFDEAFAYEGMTLVQRTPKTRQALRYGCPQR